eukprot:PRCOL_00005250-RA
MSLFGLGKLRSKSSKSPPASHAGANASGPPSAGAAGVGGIMAGGGGGSGNLREAVQLPPGEDMNEWLALNTWDFYNAVAMLHGSIAEFCTPERCPKMSAGPKYEYRWADSKGTRPIQLSAPEYVARLFAWIEGQLFNEALFPKTPGNPFPPNFRDVVKNICKRLFRVFAHMYHSHFHTMCSLGEEAHLNTCFKHFIFFVQTFDLIDKRELAPLQELISSINDVAPHSV